MSEQKHLKNLKHTLVLAKVEPTIGEYFTVLLIEKNPICIC